MRLISTWRRGTTLVEAMIALAVLTFGMLSIVRGTVAVSQQNALARKRTLAQAMARELADELRGQTYASTLLTNSTTMPGTTPPSISVSSTGTATFTPDPGAHVDSALAALPVINLSTFAAESQSSARFWRVWYASEPETGLKIVRVTVFYDDGLGGQGQVEQFTGLTDSAILAGSSTGISML